MNRRYLIDEWNDRLVLELRQRDVHGSRIGEVLAEVEAHCRDTGEAPADAFGPPGAYAAAVADATATPPLPVWRVALVAAGSIAGVLGLLAGTSGVAAGTRAAVTVGDLVTVALAALLVPLVFARLGVLADQPRGTAVLGVLVAAAVLPPVLFRDTAFTLPAVPLLTVGALLLTLTWWPRAADRIVDPRSGRERFSSGPAALAVRWVPVAVLVAAVALVLALPRV